jgi:hypothetical protein
MAASKGVFIFDINAFDEIKHKTTMHAHKVQIQQ